MRYKLGKARVLLPNFTLIISQMVECLESTNSVWENFCSKTHSDKKMQLVKIRLEF